MWRSRWVDGLAQKATARRRHPWSTETMLPGPPEADKRKHAHPCPAPCQWRPLLERPRAGGRPVLLCCCREGQRAGCRLSAAGGSPAAIGGRCARQRSRREGRGAAVKASGQGAPTSSTRGSPASRRQRSKALAAPSTSSTSRLNCRQGAGAAQSAAGRVGAGQTARAAHVLTQARPFCCCCFALGIRDSRMTSAAFM